MGHTLLLLPTLKVELPEQGGGPTFTCTFSPTVVSGVSACRYNGEQEMTWRKWVKAPGRPHRRGGIALARFSVSTGSVSGSIPRQRSHFFKQAHPQIIFSALTVTLAAVVGKTSGHTVKEFMNFDQGFIHHRRCSGNHPILLDGYLATRR